MKLGFDTFLSLIGHFNIQINPVITNPGYNEHKWPVPELFVIIEFDFSHVLAFVYF